MTVKSITVSPRVQPAASEDGPSPDARAAQKYILPLLPPRDGEGVEIARRDSGRASQIRQEVAAVRKRLRSGDRFVIDPKSANYQRWDLVTFAALCFTAIATPAEVAFVDKSPGINALFFVNRFVDAIFLVDLVLNFFLGYLDERRGNILIKTRSLITKRYLKGWFAVDLASSVPFDALSDASRVKVLSNFKPLRLLRLLKLARVTKAQRILARWEAYAVFAVSYATISICKLSGLLTIFAHWSACLWGMTANAIVVGDDGWSWVEARALNMVDARHDDPSDPDARRYFDAKSPAQRYVAALYFAVYTMTGIGYGDVVPNTPVETTVALVIMVSSAIFWAFMIGNFCNVVSTMNAQETAYRQRMDDLNYMMEDRKFPRDLRTRCRLFLVNSKEHQRTVGYRALEALFSNQLMGEVAASNNAPWLTRVWYFERLSHRFVVELSHAIVVVMFAPMEAVDIVHTLFIITAGIAARNGRILPKGAIWGEDFILEREHLVDTTCAAALSFATVSCLGRDAFFAILADDAYADERRAVQKASRFYHLRALLLRLATVHAERKRTRKDAKVKASLGINTAAHRMLGMVQANRRKASFFPLSDDDASSANGSRPHSTTSLNGSSTTSLPSPAADAAALRGDSIRRLEARIEAQGARVEAVLRECLAAKLPDPTVKDPDRGLARTFSAVNIEGRTPKLDPFAKKRHRHRLRRESDSSFSASPLGPAKGTFRATRRRSDDRAPASPQ